MTKQVDEWYIKEGVKIVFSEYLDRAKDINMSGEITYDDGYKYYLGAVTVNSPSHISPIGWFLWDMEYIYKIREGDIVELVFDIKNRKYIKSVEEQQELFESFLMIKQMAEKAITLEELLSGALLKFGRVDYTDLSLLMKELSLTANIIIVDDELMYIRDYIKVDSNGYSLRDGLTLDSNISSDNTQVLTLARKLGIEQGKIIPLFLSKLDLEKLVLKKIQMSDIPKYGIERNFNPDQLKIINDLFSSGHLAFYWDDDIPSESSEQLELTQLGKAKLFLKEHAKKIEKFIEHLKAFKNDPSLLEDFLYAQDFDKSLNEILSIENVNDYCTVHDRPYIKQTKTLTP